MKRKHQDSKWDKTKTSEQFTSDEHDKKTDRH
jgi:hypothetical protein